MTNQQNEKQLKEEKIQEYYQMISNYDPTNINGLKSLYDKIPANAYIIENGLMDEYRERIHAGLFTEYREAAIEPILGLYGIMTELNIRYDIEPYDIFKLIKVLEQVLGTNTEDVDELSMYLMTRELCLIGFNDAMPSEAVMGACIKFCVEYENEWENKLSDVFGDGILPLIKNIINHETDDISKEKIVSLESFKESRK